MGRPSSYTAEVAERILSQLPLRSLAAICAADDMPDTATVYRWRRQDEAFRREYAYAREDRAETLSDDLEELNEQVRTGVLEPAAAKVIADNKRWAMARMSPRTYGDRQVIAGDKDNPLMPEPMTPERMVEIARQLTEAKGRK